MYRVLEVCVDLDGGGIDRYLYNYCMRIDGIHFDFAAVDSKEGILEPLLAAKGYDIYHIPRLSNGVLSNFRALKAIMTANKYDVVHVHLGYFSVVALICACLCGVRTRIVHAHIANAPESKGEKLIRKILTPFTKWFATDLAACGIDAAKWVWGNRTFSQGKVTIHNNAIDTSLFAYSEEARKEYRGKMGIDSHCIAVGHVGRFSNQKNQKRLVKMFSKIHEMEPNSLLVLIGHEDAGYNVDKEIDELGLGCCTMPLGVRNDVEKLLNIMDVFVFPSKYEGLPFTLIETQCNGLPCICSDAVTEQVKCSNCIEFVSLEESDGEWAQKALNKASEGRNSSAIQDVIDAGYDINIEAGKLKKFYENCIIKHVKD